MAKYISVDDLLKEIDNLVDKGKYKDVYDRFFRDGINSALYTLKERINTLEVREIDLEKELSYEDYKSFFEKYPNLSNDWGFDESWVFAKYFFELGLKAQKGE